MKRWIYGRKAGSRGDFVLMFESEGASVHNLKSMIDIERLRQFEIDNARQAVKVLREKLFEGYVLFEGDSTRYLFTPDVDFVFPSKSAGIVVSPEKIPNGN